MKMVFDKLFLDTVVYNSTWSKMDSGERIKVALITGITGQVRIYECKLSQSSKIIVECVCDYKRFFRSLVLIY